MALRRGMGGCRLLQLPLLLLCAFLKQDLHFIQAAQANITNNSEVTPDPSHNHTKQETLYFSAEGALYSFYKHVCWPGFREMMSNISETRWCHWEDFSRPYSDLRHCLENTAEHVRYQYPNEYADMYILEGHKIYFSSCTMGNGLEDPPDGILLTLILFPICILPFLVTLVVWKSKNGELLT
ncbi:receptor activity-modifying protein 2 [Lissotriton helveticus]